MSAFAGRQGLSYRSSRLAQTHPGASTVLINEFDAGGF
jgi:hypothetical protein